MPVVRKVAREGLVLANMRMIMFGRGGTNNQKIMKY